MNTWDVTATRQRAAGSLAALDFAPGFINDSGGYESHEENVESVHGISLAVKTNLATQVLARPSDAIFAFHEAAWIVLGRDVMEALVAR